MVGTTRSALRRWDSLGCKQHALVAFCDTIEREIKEREDER
jgi:hypothetical protein